MHEPRFPTGTITASTGAGEALLAAGTAGLDLVARHARGDWGDVGPEGREENERALVEGGRIVSSYRISRGKWVWVITDSNRRSTAILLPEEYHSHPTL